MSRSQCVCDRDLKPSALISASPKVKMSHGLFSLGFRRSEEGSLWGQDLSSQGHVDSAAASALPSSPCPVQRAWVQLSPNPSRLGKASPGREGSSGQAAGNP